MNRAQLQKLANARLRDAQTLLRKGRYSGAYYLTGYAVECALKSCIAKQINKYDFPNKELAKEVTIHDLIKLLALSGLGPEHKSECNRNHSFELNWAIVKDWRVETRYELLIPETLCVDFYSAVASRPNGVLPWIKKWW